MKTNKPKSILRFVAGDSAAKENLGILIHGMHSSPAKLNRLASALAAQKTFSAIYLFDEREYRSDVSENSLSMLGSFGRPLIFYESVPSVIVESASEKLADEICSQNLSELTLIGHSLGGFVARCTLEAWKLRDRVRSLVTLSAPHLAYRLSSPKYWKMRPLKNFPYLLLVGEADDFIWPDVLFGSLMSDLSLFDLSRRDEALDVTKIMIPEADHSSIHREASDNHVAKLIGEFSRSRGLNKTHPFYVKLDEDGEAVLCFDSRSASRMGSSRRSGRRYRPSNESDWLWFEDSDG